MEEKKKLKIVFGKEKEERKISGYVILRPYGERQMYSPKFGAGTCQGGCGESELLDFAR